MSRGGRGGGFRGGRGGRGGAGGGPIIPGMEENMEFIEKKPSELYPPYDIPTAAPLTKKEDRAIALFLLFREQVHDGPLFTQTRTLSLDPGEPARTYGQEQINKRYGVKNKATVDPFLAMPTYSQRFTRQERALPDLASRPFAKEYFPAELHATLEGEDTPGTGKKRKGGKKTLALSNITELRTAEDIFMGGTADGDADSHSKALALLEKLGEGEEGGVEDLLAEDDDWVVNNEDGEGEAEEEYDDESDNDDYNAEQYFDDGEGDDDMDEGGGGGDEY